MPDERPGGSATLPTPAARVTPASIPATADAVREAVADGATLRIAGAGTWLHAGAPVEATRVLDLSSLSGIVEYVPGDLTLTARAGTSLAEVADATAPHGQWLALDPFGASAGTIGATLATASAGPLAGSVGAPRDVALGVTFVAGDGAIVQGGGRVVKNVAGFDLTRLTIGAWGTLGAIVEASVRLRARPEADATVAMTLPGERAPLAALLTRVRGAPVEPLAAELVSPVLAHRLGLGTEAMMLVRVAGNRTSVAHQRGALQAIAPCREVAPAVWSQLQASDPAAALVLRVSRRPSELARLWTTAMATADVDAHATLARGIVRLRLTAPSQGKAVSAFDAADHRVLESVPPAWHGTVAWSGPADPLSRRLRLAFDPHRLLNRGILGEDAP